MHKDFYGWSLENIDAGKVETKYTIEYINDQKTWDKLCKTEDIELYSKKEYDNVSEAISFYLTWFISDQCYDIKLWEQVFVNDRMVLEQIIEPQSTIINSMRFQIDKDMRNKLYQTENTVKELSEQNKLLMDFIKRIHGENMLEEFIEIKVEENKNV